MAKVPNAVEILSKNSTAWVGRTNVTDDRQTDGRATANSEREREFTFTNKIQNKIQNKSTLLMESCAAVRLALEKTHINYTNDIVMLL